MEGTGIILFITALIGLIEARNKLLIVGMSGLR